MNILVRMPNWIGDIVMGTPVLEDLRKHFPNASLTAMCLHPACHLLENDPAIDELFCFHKKRYLSRRDAHRNIIEKMKNGKYDIGILLTNSFSSAWLFWQGHIPRRIGFVAHMRSLLLTDPLPFPASRQRQHLTRTYKALLSPLGIQESETAPTLYITDEEKAAATEFLKHCGTLPGECIIGINPTAAYGAAKCWPPERFRILALKLAQSKEKPKIIFFGSNDQIPSIKEICRDLPPSVINAAGGTTLRELMALIAACSLLVTNDSGPMHIADAFNVPVIALFGSTDPIVTGPYRGQGKVIAKNVPCAPCFKRTCPIDFRCMTQITVDEVYREVLVCLAGSKTH